MPYQVVAERWHDFYIVAGTAAATLVGLLFVASAVSPQLLGAGVFSLAVIAPSLVAAGRSRTRTLRPYQLDTWDLLVSVGAATLDRQGKPLD